MSSDFVVNISKQFDLKIEAVGSYTTQFYNPDSDEPDTIISTNDFLDSVSYRAKDLGRQTSCTYAEGFINHQLSKINLLNDLNIQ